MTPKPYLLPHAFHPTLVLAPESGGQETPLVRALCSVIFVPACPSRPLFRVTLTTRRKPQGCCWVRTLSGGPGKKAWVQRPCPMRALSPAPGTPCLGRPCSQAPAACFSPALAWSWRSVLGLMCACVPCEPQDGGASAPRPENVLLVLSTRPLASSQIREGRGCFCRAAPPRGASGPLPPAPL